MLFVRVFAFSQDASAEHQQLREIKENKARNKEKMVKTIFGVPNLSDKKSSEIRTALATKTGVTNIEFCQKDKMVAISYDKTIITTTKILIKTMQSIQSGLTVMQKETLVGSNTQTFSCN